MQPYASRLHACVSQSCLVSESNGAPKANLKYLPVVRTEQLFQCPHSTLSRAGLLSEVWRITDPGSMICIQDLAYRILDLGTSSWIHCSGYMILDPGSRMLDPDPGSQIHYQWPPGVIQDFPWALQCPSQCSYSSRPHVKHYFGTIATINTARLQKATRRCWWQVALLGSPVTGCALP